jgi:hypothetical protein
MIKCRKSGVIMNTKASLKGLTAVLLIVLGWNIPALCGAVRDDAKAKGSDTGSAQKITVKGDIIAVPFWSIALLLNGFVHTEIIVQVSQPTNLKSQFILVRLSMPEDKYEKWIDSLSSLHSFRVQRKKAWDEPLNQCFPIRNISSGSEDMISRWHLMSGHEDVQLPFNKSIMTFESLDWPVIPVL